MANQAHQSQHPAPTLPAALADVALIDARTSAATGGMGISWWHARVAAGEAPKPAIQQPRMTRWRLADVRAFWAQRAQAGSPDASEKLQTQATNASAAAARKRNGKTATSTNAG